VNATREKSYEGILFKEFPSPITLREPLEPTLRFVNINTFDAFAKEAHAIAFLNTGHDSLDENLNT